MNTPKMATNRWYVVADKRDNARCLVEANAPGQALRRAAEHYCHVRTATVAETIEMIRGECDVISAPSTPEQMEMEDIPGLMPQSPGKEDGTPEVRNHSSPPEPLTVATLAQVVEREDSDIVSGRAADVFDTLGDNNDEI